LNPALQGILLTAVLGAAAAYLHQLWKYSKDAYHARVDEACELILEIADRGAEYWSVGRLPDISFTKRERLKLAEVQITGRIAQLQFLRLMLQSRFSLFDRDRFNELIATFQDASTGGDFASNARDADLQRANGIYVAAADLTAHVRDAAGRGNRLWLIIFREVERWLPYRRPVTRAGRIEELLWLSFFLGLFATGSFLVIRALSNWLEAAL